MGRIRQFTPRMNIDSGVPAVWGLLGTLGLGGRTLSQSDVEGSASSLLGLFLLLLLPAQDGGFGPVDTW
jgi:hypothetical protein